MGKNILTPAEPVAGRMNKLAANDELTARNADKHWLYEKSVQTPDVEVVFIDRVFKKEFGRLPAFLREDFCGTAILCAEWAKRRGGNTALGVDLDGPTLEWGRVNNINPLGDRSGAVTHRLDDLLRPADVFRRRTEHLSCDLDLARVQ